MAQPQPLDLRERRVLRLQPALDPLRGRVLGLVPDALQWAQAGMVGAMLVQHEATADLLTNCLDGPGFARQRCVVHIQDRVSVVAAQRDLGAVELGAVPRRVLADLRVSHGVVLEDEAAGVVLGEVAPYSKVRERRRDVSRHRAGPQHGLFEHTGRHELRHKLPVPLLRVGIEPQPVDRRPHLGFQVPVGLQEGGQPLRCALERDDVGRAGHGADAVARATCRARRRPPQSAPSRRLLRALSYDNYNDYAADAALAGASFQNAANMTRPDPCAA